jgi:DNA repair ATPase RecN
MKSLFIGLMVTLLAIIPRSAFCQVQELEQLALDIEKLAQMKSILSEMYKGYEILSGGYNTIKSLAEGNFNLHSAYLNGLLQVSPTVKSYVRVADIISAQATLVSEYKSAYTAFSKSGSFSATELNYITGVYANLFNQSLNNLDELVMILTDSKLRASDAERLNGIDHIYNDIQDKLSFLRMFNSKAGILATQRQQGLQDNSNLKSLFGQ